MNEEESKATCTLCKKRQSKYRQITEEGLCDKCVSKADNMSSLNDNKVEEDIIQEVANDIGITTDDEKDEVIIQIQAGNNNKQ